MKLSKLRCIILVFFVVLVAMMTGLSLNAESGDEIIASAPPAHSDIPQVLIVCFVGIGTMAYGAFMIKRADDD